MAAIALSLAALVLVFLNGRSTRQEMKRHMTDINTRLAALNDKVTQLETNFVSAIEAETAQQRETVQALRDLINSGQTFDAAAANAIIDQIESSLNNLGETVLAKVVTIVPDLESPEPATEADAIAGPAPDFAEEPEPEPTPV